MQVLLLENSVIIMRVSAAVAAAAAPQLDSPVVVSTV